jgi:branched-chain amino acid transport system substrate-binding protein
MRLTPLLPAVATLALAGGLVACASGGPTAATTSPSVVSIGVIYPTAGSESTAGIEEQQGVQLAAEWANDHHALGTRQIRLVEAPADRAEAVPAQMELLARQGIKLVIGSDASALSQTAALFATENHELFWETGAVGQTLPGTGGGSSFFRVSPMGSNLGSSAVDFIDHELAPKLAPRPLRYAVVYVNDAYGREVGDGAAAEVRKLGLPLVGDISYDLSTVNYAALAAQIAALHPDVLYVSAYIPDAIALRRQLVAQKVPLLANIGTSSSYCMLAFGVPLGPEAVGLFASDKPDAADVNPAALTPEGRAALAWVSATYQARYHQAMSAPALSGFSSATALFSHVLPAAKADTPKGVAAAALATQLPQGTLANGSGLDLAPPGTPDAGDNRAATSVIWEWVAPGQRAVVWPLAYANHPITVLPIDT